MSGILKNHFVRNVNADDEDQPPPEGTGSLSYSENKNKNKSRNSNKSSGKSKPATATNLSNLSNLSALGSSSSLLQEALKTSQFWNPRFRLGKVSANFASTKGKMKFFDDGHSFNDTVESWQGLDSYSYSHARPHLSFGELKTTPGAGEYHTDQFDTNFGNRVSTPLATIDKSRGTTPVLPSIGDEKSTVSFSIPLPKEILNKPVQERTVLFISSTPKVPGDFLRHAVSPGPLAYASNVSSVSGTGAPKAVIRKKDTAARQNISKVLDRPPPGPASYDLSYDPSSAGNLTRIISKLCRESKGSDFIPGIKHIFDTAKSAGYLGKMIGSEVSNNILQKHHSKSEKLLNYDKDKKDKEDEKELVESDLGKAEDPSNIRWANNCVLRKPTKQEKYLSKLEDMLNNSKNKVQMPKHRTKRPALDLMNGWPFGINTSYVKPEKVIEVKKKDKTEGEGEQKFKLFDTSSVRSAGSSKSRRSLSSKSSKGGIKSISLLIDDDIKTRDTRDDNESIGGASISTFGDNSNMFLSVDEDNLNLDMEFARTDSPKKLYISPLKLSKLSGFKSSPTSAGGLGGSNSGLSLLRDQFDDDNLLNSIGSTRRLEQVDIDVRIQEIQVLFYNNMFDKSIKAAEQYLIQLRHLSGLLVNYNRICIMCHIGDCYKSMGHFQNAFEYYENSLSLSVNIFGDKSVCAASILSIMGELYRTLGQLEHSRNLVLSAFKTIKVEIHRSNKQMTMTEKDYIVATYSRILISLAYTYIDTCDLSKLPALMLKLSTLVDEFYMEFSILGQFFTLQVNYYRLIGNYEEALKQANLMMQLYKDCEVSATSFLMADVLVNQYNVYMDMCNYPESSRLLTEIVKIREGCYGTNHYLHADITYIQGVFNMEIGQYSVAMKSFQESLTLKISTFGKQHFSVCQILVHLANCQRMRGFPKAADECIDFFWSLAETGDAYISDLMMHELYVVEANNNVSKGKFGVALELFSSAMQLIEKIQTSLNLESYKAADACKLYMARALYLSGEYKYAHHLLKECEVSIPIHFPRHHFHNSLLMFFLGEYYFTVGSYLQAKDISERALANFELSKDSSTQYANNSTVQSTSSVHSQEPQSGTHGAHGYYSIELLVLISRIEAGLGNPSEALYLISQAKKQIKSGYRRSVLDAVASACMAEYFRINKQVNEADEYYTIAANILFNAVGDNNNYFYGKLLASKAEYLGALKKDQDAQVVAQSASEVLSSVVPLSHVTAVEILFLQSFLKFQAGDTKGAEAMFREVVIPYLEVNIDFEHPIVFFSQVFLGRSVIANTVKTEIKEQAWTLVNEGLDNLRQRGILETHPWMKVLAKEEDDDRSPLGTPILGTRR